MLRTERLELPGPGGFDLQSPVLPHMKAFDLCAIRSKLTLRPIYR